MDLQERRSVVLERVFQGAGKLVLVLDSNLRAAKHSWWRLWRVKRLSAPFPTERGCHSHLPQRALGGELFAVIDAAERRVRYAGRARAFRIPNPRATSTCGPGRCAARPGPPRSLPLHPDRFATIAHSHAARRVDGYGDLAAPVQGLVFNVEYSVCVISPLSDGSDPSARPQLFREM